MKKQTNIKKLSGNDIYELFGCIQRVQATINDTYLHVSEFFPDSIKKDIEEFQNKLFKEAEKRGY